MRPDEDNYSMQDIVTFLGDSTHSLAKLNGSSLNASGRREINSLRLDDICLVHQLVDKMPIASNDVAEQRQDNSAEADGTTPLDSSYSKDKSMQMEIPSPVQTVTLTSGRREMLTQAPKPCSQEY